MKLLLGGRSRTWCCGIVLVTTACGCATVGRMMPWRAASPQASVITEGEAIRIAKRAVRAKNPDIQTIRARAVFRDGRWDVSANYTVGFDLLGVITADEHCSVLVDASGRVLGYRSGASPR